MGIKDVKLSVKFLVSFLAIGIVPFIAIGITSLQKAKNSLREQAFSQLESVREIKKTQLNSYLNYLKNQILTFSEDRMIIDAMVNFAQDFDGFLKDNGMNRENIQSMKQKLRSYYENDFSKEYKKQNDGRSPDFNRIFEGLDDESVALQYCYIKDNRYPLGSKDNLDRAGDRP